jgi:hypothetical protein
MDYRAILFHKQATSARLRFLRYEYGSICATQAIPPLAQVHVGRQDNPTLHPAAVLRHLERELGFEPGSLRAEQGYRFMVGVPNENIPVFLVAIESIDPPFELTQRIGAEFIDLTQARDLTQVELELLRGAYELVLGG